METVADGTAPADREIVVSRIIEGPQRLVFEAYTNPVHLAHWYGPNGFTTTTHSFEFRPGGVWDFTMHGPDGANFPNRIEWLEITPPERIVFLHGEGEYDPEMFTSTVTIGERGDLSEVTLHSVFKTKGQRDKVVEKYHAIEGAEQTLSRLAAYLATPVEPMGQEGG